MRRKTVTFLASLGAGLEYYDFVIYALMTPYLARLFFAKSDPVVGMLVAMGIFAVGYAARPLGGVCAGMLADRLGRKRTFLVVMLIMAVATFAIGLLPVYAVGGLASAFLLVLCRILQGLSFGAELPGAITVVSEYAEARSRGRQCGFVISSASCGSILASMVLLGLNSYCTESVILDWAWRLPFLLGGLLALVSYVLRSGMDETPAFIHHKAALQYRSFWGPLQALMRDHGRSVLMACGLSILPTSLIITNIFYPNFLKTTFEYSAPDLYLTTTLSLVYSALVTPLCGMLADRFGKENVFFASSVGFMPAILGGFVLLFMGKFWSLLLFMIINQTFISLLMSSYFALIAERFPVNVRYTAMAFCYNSVYVLASLLPMLFTSVLNRLENPWCIPFVLCLLAGVAAFSLLGMLKGQGELGLRSA